MKYLLDQEETNRLHFKLVDIADYNSWIDFFRDSSYYEHWIGERQTAEIECDKWFEKQLSRYTNDLGGMNALVEKSTGKLIGYGGLLVQYVDDTKELEIAYSLLPAHRNKGYATEAARKCMDYAFENNFTDSLISIISLTNTPSANVAAKNGMRIEKQTSYKENQVNIFRIGKSDWTRKGER